MQYDIWSAAKRPEAFKGLSSLVLLEARVRAMQLSLIQAGSTHVDREMRSPINTTPNVNTPLKEPIDQSTLGTQVGPFMRSLVASAVIGPVTVVIVISFVTLVYAGAPPEFLARGVGLTLFGSLLFAALSVFAGSVPGVVHIAQDNPAAILGLATAGIVGSMSATAPPESIFATIAGAVVLSSLLTAALFLLLGALRLGNLVRYLPYPVIGGFLAGTGVLMIQGAIRSMTGVAVSFGTLSTLLSPDALVQWLPGLLLGALLTVALRRYSHFLLLPGILVVATALFYLCLWIGGISLAEARHQGLLLATLPSGTLWQPLSPAMLTQVDWRVLGAQMGTLIAIPILCTIAILLNGSGFELIRRRDLDFNRELRVAGIGNLLSGLSGSHPGYMALSLSTLVQRMGASTRATGLLITLIFGAALGFGASVLAYIPPLLLGGIVLFLGFSFVIEWLYDTWFRLNKLDYLVIVAILVAINGIGMLAGVALGTGLAVIIFVFDYSRINVVKHALSGANYHSTVDRPSHQRTLLMGAAERLHIFELQGYLFFGTANRLLEQVRQRVEASELPVPHYLLLDFRQVNGMDASAVLSFVKMKQLAAIHNIVLIFTHLSPLDRERLQSEVLTPNDCGRWRVFADLDHGVEWCEEQIIAGAPIGGSQRASAVEQLAQLLSGHPQAKIGVVGQSQPANAVVQSAQRLLEQMERRALEPGDYVIRQGQAPHGLYFLTSGQLTAQLDMPDGRAIRLRAMQPGVVVGELGLYTNTAASASVVVDEPSIVYYLPAQKLAQLAESHPELAAALHFAIAQLVSARLLTATTTIEALRR